MSTVLISGASSGLGALTAATLARAGHTVFAGMRDPEGRNRNSSEVFQHAMQAEGLAAFVVDLDVQSQESAGRAVQEVLDTAGGLDVVVHNAGHLALGYAEAFSAEELARNYDVNALGAHRLNRAALPHLRAQRSGTLLYVGSTTTVSVPPFMAPYVMSKLAFDGLALTTAYEVSQFGIETTIVMPGAFVRGTDHFANASTPADADRSGSYAALNDLVDAYEDATRGLFAPGTDPDPGAVADEIARLVALPRGGKPLRSIVDFTRSDVGTVTRAMESEAAGFLRRMGFQKLLELQN